MKKPMHIVIFYLAAALLFAGCAPAGPSSELISLSPRVESTKAGSGTQPTEAAANNSISPPKALSAGESSPALSAPEPQQSSPAASAPEPQQRGTGLAALPEMAPELQDYARCYLAPAQRTLLGYDFSDPDYSVLLKSWGTLVFLVEDFYFSKSTDDANSYRSYWDRGADGFDAEFFEGVLQEHLSLTSQQIQTAFGDRYSSESKKYYYEDGRGGPAYTTAIVTGVEGDTDTIQLYYDAYSAYPVEAAGWQDRYDYAFSGRLTIKTEAGAFHYIKNEKGVS